MRKRREFSPEYKSKLVLEVLREENTLSEIAARESINAKQLGNWKSEFIRNAGRVFSQSNNEKAAMQETERLQEKERDYQAKVGQLTLENDFLKSVYKKISGQEFETKNGFKY